MSNQLLLRRRVIMQSSIKNISGVLCKKGAYIDTGVIPSKTIAIEVKYDALISYDTNAILFGSYNTYWYGFRPFKSAFIYIHDFASTNNARISGIAKLDGNKAYYNGALVGTGKEGSLSYTMPSIAIGGEHNVNGYWLATTSAIYYCKVWDNDVLIRDYIPCIISGVVGFYDKINGTFNPSLGVPFVSLDDIMEVKTITNDSEEISYVYGNFGKSGGIEAYRNVCAIIPATNARIMNIITNTTGYNIAFAYLDSNQQVIQKDNQTSTNNTAYVAIIFWDRPTIETIKNNDWSAEIISYNIY